MPYVNIKITREGATPEQKAALIKGATQLLVDVLGKTPATTMVVIDEVDTDNWGIGGESITERRKAGSPASSTTAACSWFSSRCGAVQLWTAKPFTLYECGSLAVSKL